MLLLKRIELDQLLIWYLRFSITVNKNYIFTFIKTKIDFEKIRKLLTLIFSKDCKIYSYAEFKKIGICTAPVQIIYS